MPTRCVHNFKWAALDEGARIDFYRGLPSDDWGNAQWTELFDKLPRYRAHLKDNQNPRTVKGKGNAMERVAGISFACFTDFVHLPTGHTLTFPEKEDLAKSCARWAEVWPQLQRLGIKASTAPASGPSCQQTRPKLPPRLTPAGTPPRPRPSPAPEVVVSVPSGLKAGTFEYGNYQGHLIAPQRTVR